MINCPLTGSPNTRIIYEQKDVPLIQNKVYDTKEDAKKAICINVNLAQSLDNGYVFSAGFDESKIDYNEHYQNEQSISAYFQKHLENVMGILQENKLLDGKVVEIGCGKGYFMDMLLQKGVDVTGFDPAYEGSSPGVVKDFFSAKYADLNADLVIIRHALDHIATPFHFIKTVAAANNYKGKIFIEAPDFEWIVANNATEDIFYEHCDYFTQDTLQMFFTKSTGGPLFNGQYFYVIADLADVKTEIEKREIKTYNGRFAEKLTAYENLVNGLKNVAVWGAGAKGSTFLNLLDKECKKIRCAVEINPKKQHKYIGGTGHYIIEPEELAEWNIENIIVMNSNYTGEIKAITDPLNIKLITL